MPAAAMDSWSDATNPNNRNTARRSSPGVAGTCITLIVVADMFMLITWGRWSLLADTRGSASACPLARTTDPLGQGPLRRRRDAIRADGREAAEVAGDAVPLVARPARQRTRVNRFAEPARVAPRARSL